MKLRDDNTPSYIKREMLKSEETNTQKTNSQKAYTKNEITETANSDLNSTSNSIESKSASKSTESITGSKAISKAKTNNLHIGHRDRLKSQYIQNGIQSMTEIQQLELLLFYSIPQKDTNPIAHKLLNKFGSLKNVLNASIRDLCTVEGIKENSATFLKIVSNISNVSNMPKPGVQIHGTTTAKEFCKNLYVGVHLEQFYVSCLNADNKIIGSKLIKSGTVNQVHVNIRDITEYAMSLGSDLILISHNHPEGSCVMSDEDARFTYSLMCSCLLNSIQILDHIIVGNDSCFSLAENGVLEKIGHRANKHILITKDTFAFLAKPRKPYVIDNSYDFPFEVEF